MSKAFDNLRVVDATHVLAGPFASYQMAVLGAEVIKVESPSTPDQARLQGSDRHLNNISMGTAFMTQASNKKSIALDLKTSAGREAMQRLIQSADVLVENYRPGAFDALGLGYQAMSQLNPALIYCSVSAYGATGPKRELTAYDSVIQAFSGMMAMTGHGDDRPLKSGTPVVDYATGTTAAFAIATALFQRERNGGKGQFIDVSMLDVATMLCSPHVTDYLWSGKHPQQTGNAFAFATIGCYQATDAPLMIAASNLRQQRRLWAALGREDLIKQNNNQRLDAYAEERAALSSIIGTMSADYWEHFLQQRNIPVARVRRFEESLADPQITSRSLLHRHNAPNSPADGLTVPVAGFSMSASPTEVNLPPQPVGAQSTDLLTELGYSKDDIEAMRQQGVTL